MGGGVDANGALQHTPNNKIKVHTRCNRNNIRATEEAQLSRFYVQNVRCGFGNNPGGIFSRKNCLISGDGYIHPVANIGEPTDIACRNRLFDETYMDAE